jgi:hypothetical protein
MLLLSLAVAYTFIPEVMLTVATSKACAAVFICIIAGTIGLVVLYLIFRAIRWMRRAPEEVNELIRDVEASVVNARASLWRAPRRSAEQSVSGSQSAKSGTMTTVTV